MKKQNVLIYGVGKYYSQNETNVDEIYNIVAYVDREKRGLYAEKEIIKLDEIARFRYDKIIIMIQDIQECINIANELLHKGVRAEDIVLGHSLFGSYSEAIDKMAVQPDGKLLLTFRDISVKVKSKDEFNNVYAVFVDHIYNYFINNKKRDIVFDVGMNIGDATLYFAVRDKIGKVYGYEPFGETFQEAKENLKDYLLEEKVEIFNYGISDENAIREIGFNHDMSCGQSTLSDVREKTYEKYAIWGLVNEANEQKEQITVKRASEVFKPVIEANPDYNIILKMNCEGEEYNIISDLSQSGVLQNIDFVMLEWHYKGKDIILNNLREAGFSWWSINKSREMGFVYAYK